MRQGQACHHPSACPPHALSSTFSSHRACDNAGWGPVRHGSSDPDRSVSITTPAAPAVAGAQEERMGKYCKGARGAVSHASCGNAGEAHHSDFCRMLGPRPFSAKGKVPR